jgi:putative FmdB family regulatory protein
MPLYAYRCNDCRNEFETRQRMADDPLTECPVCEGQIRRVINQVGVVFKGSGFYVTDNKGKNPAAPSTVENGSEKKEKSAVEGTTKSETAAEKPAAAEEKSAPKPETKPTKKAEPTSTS